MLKIQDLEIKVDNKKYMSNYELADNEMVGLFCKDKKFISVLLKYLAGINYSNDVTLDDKIVYENSSYIKRRLYMDLQMRYLSTIKPSQITYAFESLFHKQFHEETFIKKLKEYNVRSEMIITSVYSFTNAGINYVNRALLESLDYDFVIIDNPTYNIKDQELNRAFFQNLKDRNTLLTIIALNDLSTLSNIFTKVVLYDDDGKSHIFSYNQSFIVVDNNSITEKEEILFTSGDNKRLVLSTIPSKSNLKKYRINNISYAEVLLKDLEEYL